MLEALKKGVEAEIEARCGARAANVDDFVECSGQVSREYVGKIGEYVKAMYAVDEMLVRDVKEFGEAG